MRRPVLCDDVDIIVQAGSGTRYRHKNPPHMIAAPIVTTASTLYAVILLARSISLLRGGVIAPVAMQLRTQV